MGVRWLSTDCVLLLLGSLCCISLAHGRMVRGGVEGSGLQRGGVELGSVSDGLEGDVALSASESQSFSPSFGGVFTTIDDTDSDQQSENHSVSVSRGSKWKRTLGKVAEWVLHTCVVLLALFVTFYTISCVCACCIGLDILAEIWRTLGGWAIVSYFVRVEQAVAETDPEPLPLLRSAAQEP